MNDAIDFSTLKWVKTELDESLKQGRQSLEAYVANPSEGAHLAALEACMHQVYGTLQMVEIYGAAMLAEEMEQLVRAFKADRVRQRNDAYDVLMRSILQLPDYLDRLAAGYRDVPIVLLPLLNDLRALRGEHLLSESRLFAPELNVELPSGARRLAASPDAKRAVKELRHRFQVGLLSVFRDQNVAYALNTLGEVAESMIAYAPSDAMARAWWVASGVVAALKDDTLQTNAAIKLLLGKLDRCLRNIIDEDKSAISRAEIDELSQNLLFYIGHSESVDPKVQEIRDAFQIQHVMPGGRELDEARQSLSGTNTDLFKTVASALKEELARLKDNLDNVIRDGGGNPGEIPPITESLRAMSDTLGMLGMGGQRRAILDKACALEATLDSGELPAESFLMDTAGTLILVESSLDGMAHGRRILVSAENVDANEAMIRSEFEQVREVVLGEAIVDLARGKEAFVSFTKESDGSLLEETVQTFGRVKGSLLLLGEHRAAAIMGSVLLQIRRDIQSGANPPDSRGLDLLADAICGVEYYVEGLRERRVFSESAIERAEQSLHELGVPPLLEADVPASADHVPPQIDEATAATDVATWDDLPEPVYEAEAEPPVSVSAESELQVELEEAVAEPAAESSYELLDEDHSSERAGHVLHEADAFAIQSEPEEPVTEPGGEYLHANAADFEAEMAHLAVIGEDNDEEIIEIFIEEAEEEIANITEILPVWIADSADRNALSTLRRSFHTLKGSGRLVGAMRIGEFAWAYESMLNRVIDGTLEPGSVIFDLLEKAGQALPDLVTQIRNRGPLTLPAYRLMTAVNAAVAGEPVGSYWLEPDASVESDHQMEPVSGPESFAEAGSFDVVEHRASTDTEAVTEPSDSAANERHSEQPLIEFDEPISWPEQPDDTFESEQPLNLAADDDSSGSDFDEGVEESVEMAATSEHAESMAPESVMDPVLYEIFNAESLTHLATIDRVLNGGELRVTDALTRALHTLHGSANMAMVVPLAQVAGALEKYCKLLADWNCPLSDDDFDMLVVGREMMGEILAGLPGRIDEPAGFSEFIDRVHGAQQSAADTHAESPAPTFEVETEGQLSEIPAEDLVAETTEGQTDEIPEHVEPEASTDLQETLVEFNEDVANSDSTESPYADIDEELLQIFVEESAEILERSEDALTAWSQEAGDSLALERLQRELHTVKGGARMAELTPVADLAHAMETLVNAIAEGRIESRAQALTLCIEAHDVLVQQVERVRTRSPMIEVADLVNRLDVMEKEDAGPAQEEVAETTPEDVGAAAATAAETVDPELVQIFVEEAGDVLEHSENALQAWKHEPQDTSQVAALQRSLHTLKGGARMAGIMAVGDLSHAMESLIIDCAENKSAVSEALFATLQTALDRIVSMVANLAAGETVMPAEDLRHQLEMMRYDRPVHDAKDETESATVAVETGQEKAQAAEFPRVDRRAHVREANELVRVRADLLDSLVNNAGEVSIYRARIEQQVGALRFNLTEMDQTVARLRDQLRKLEIETEAQILFRYEREIESGDGEFDPLELDRYSQLQQLSRSLMESVADLNSLQSLLENVTRESETLLLQQARVNTELQEGLMHTRMVPFLGLAPRMRRIVRQTCQEVGKKAELELSGAEGELDRTVIDRIIAPIEHMLRNAISHGIETPAERRATGKPETGTIRITFGRESSDVVLRIADDGAGVNLSRVRAKAIERGLMQADANLSDNDMLQFILETGFSTASQVSQVAGRGVGMDVVNSEVRQLGGALQIDSRDGAGTTFTIRLPFTLAINQSLLVDVSDNTYAIPLSSIQGIVRVDRDQLLKHHEDPELKLEYGGSEYEVRYLGELLGTRKPGLGGSQAKVPMLLARAGNHAMALQVDGLVGSREIVVKSVGPQISTVRGISGATILGDGRVVMILDIAALLRGGISPLSKVEEIFHRAPKSEVITVMVVDDSITVRKVTGRLLERSGMRVVTAKDGVDAVAKLNEVIPDIMLLDIEMPRMDGFELATHVRNEPELKHIPIIMITSRTGDKHRQRAMEIGVDRYLGKPFQESELLENINSLTGRPALHG